MSEQVRVVQNAGVLEIVLNRPECGNLVTMNIISEITERLRNVPATIRLLVVRGEGGDFCRGRDYHDAPEDKRQGQPNNAAQVRDRMTAPILGMYSIMKELPIPTLSIVQGAATGFGCALACGCDIVLAGRSARFSLPEMRERGLPPTLAMTALFDRIGYRALTYLVYSGAEIEGQAALSAGLVSAVFEDDDLETRSRQVVEAVSTLPAESVGAVKRYLKHAPSMDSRGRAELGANLFAVASSSR